MEKIKKNKIFIALIFLLIVCAMVAIFVPGKVTHADILTINDYSDKFSDLTLSDKWKTNEDASLKVKNNALVFESDGMDVYMTQVTYSKFRMTGPCKVEMNTILDSGNGYIAFTAGNSQAEIGMPFASLALIMAPNYVHIYINQDGFIQPQESLVQYFSPTLSEYVGQELKTTLVFNETEIKGHYDIDYILEVVETGEKLGSCTYYNITILDDSLFGLNACTNISLVNFNIYYDFDGENYNNAIEISDFSNQTIKYPAGGPQDADWVAVLDYNEKDFKVGSISVLDVSTIDSYALFKEPFTRSTSKEIEKLYTLSVDAIVDDMDIGVATGFEIAKKSETESGVFAGLVKDSEGFNLTTFNGINQQKVLIPDFESGDTLSLVVNYDNTATISCNGVSLTVFVGVIDGYFALTSKDFYSSFAGAKGACLDNFIYKHDSYSNSNSKDLSINFEGTKTVFNEATQRDKTGYYISTKDWVKTSSVINKIYKKSNENNYLSFCGNFFELATFGPNYKYTNFVARFDINFFKDYSPETDHVIFGLQFGKPKKNSALNSSSYLGFEYFVDYTLQNGTTYVVCNNGELSTGGKITALTSDPYNQVQYNIFKKDTTYNVMYIVENGTAKLYLKESTESNYVFSILRAELTGVETEGFVSVFGAQGANFALDNFSIVNLDYNILSSKYDGNGYETLRTDFSMGDKLTKFSKKNCDVLKTEVKVNEGGYIISDDNIGNSIFRLKTTSNTGDLVLEKGELKVIFNKEGDLLTIIHNKKIREFVLENKIDFNGALIEIFKMGNDLRISYVNSNQPTSCIKYNTFNIVADNLFEGKFKIYSNNGTMGVSAISVFDLKENVTIQRKDYDPKVDYINPWTKRTSIQEKEAGNTTNKEKESSGCGSNITSIAIISPILVVVSFVLIRRKKDEKN